MILDLLGDRGHPSFRVDGILEASHILSGADIVLHIRCGIYYSSALASAGYPFRHPALSYALSLALDPGSLVKAMQPYFQTILSAHCYRGRKK